MASRRSFGKLRKLPSKRWQASYVGPDTVRHVAPSTFAARIDAEAWLAGERELAARPDWVPPGMRDAVREANRPPLLALYAEGWLNSRSLTPRTRALYRDLLDRFILPSLGDRRLDELTPVGVREWHTLLGPHTPTQRAHAYSLLRAILRTANDERLISDNPCVIRGAGAVRRKSETVPATLDELDAIVQNMPERLRLAVQLAAWCGLRQGELVELRRGDLDVSAQVIRVRRAVTRVAGQGPIVGKPKSEAGQRDVAIPPHLLPAITDHLDRFVPPAKTSLLFAGRDSGEQLSSSTLYRWFHPARVAAGRPDLRWHDLRHTGATYAALAGATLPELMKRIGHSTVRAAMAYQHVAQDRDRTIAENLSRLTERKTP